LRREIVELVLRLAIITITITIAITIAITITVAITDRLAPPPHIGAGVGGIALCGNESYK
jgi:archaellum biogenesis protein FlaJ (TadC family)